MDEPEPEGARSAAERDGIVDQQGAALAAVEAVEDDLGDGEPPASRPGAGESSTTLRARALVERLEQKEALDTAAAAVSARLPGCLVSGRGREVLSGSWLGHALHPLLTDFPLGCWASASLLDLVGLGRHPEAARRLVGLGIVASVPTAAAGLSDWSRLGTRDRRVGLVHAQLNSVALGFYIASYLARRRRRNGRGILLAVAGGLVATASGYLGGHLTTTRAVTRDDKLIDAPVGGAT